MSDLREAVTRALSAPDFCTHLERRICRVCAIDHAVRLVEQERKRGPEPPYPYFWRTAIQREKERWHRLKNELERRVLPNLRRWKQGYKSHQPQVSILAKRLNAAEKRAEAAEKALREHKCKLPDSIEWALNSGDGVYRP